MKPSRPPTGRDAMALLMLGGFIAWLIGHARPDLWFTPTWATGGDTAAHLFYAREFSHWFWQGKISSWMPESFTGFPAFSFYFPFPFILIALISPLLGFQIAFKLIAMLPSFLLPLAAYALGRSARWPIPVSLSAALAAAGVILGEETSIWGGNVLAQLAGEFAYNWGMTLTLVFWALVIVALRHGRLWWIVAAVAEAAVALCHGYPLLIAGFGSFALLFLAHPGWRAVGRLIAIHTLAFLLVGFWLIPLIANLPWTIPNDTAVWLEQWQTAWPRSLWPLTLGLPLSGYLWWRLPETRPTLTALALISLLSLLAFHIGHRIGLAELRFYAYAQWAWATIAAIGIGWLLVNKTTTPMLWITAFAMALMAWWEPGIVKIEQWSRWNLEGYENKPLWPAYQQLAAASYAPLQGPRTVFEHDPDNTDLGSTRALEALPLFGAGPMLEGLYMESALSGPFIYKLQAEVSAQPSSPLTRFPSLTGTVDEAVAHMEELFADKLILRSDPMKKKFLDDPRFEIIAEPDPFTVLRLNPVSTQFIETVRVPLIPTSLTGWQDTAYRRFVLAHPYQNRRVYGADLRDLPATTTEVPAARIELLAMSRERLVFRTNAVGAPHLIRMSYHPRWRSLTGERIFLTDPAFMLLFPRQEQVTLVFAPDRANYLGWIFSAIAAAIILVAALFAKRCLPPPLPPSSPVRTRFLLLMVAVFAAALAVNAVTDPERLYQQGHRQFRSGHWAEAARAFTVAAARRHHRAARAEALFWAARSWHISGRTARADRLYAELRQRYPENYWYPESTMRQVEIAINDGRRAAAESIYQELQRRFPDNPWTAEAKRVLEPAKTPAPALR